MVSRAAPTKSERTNGRSSAPTTDDLQDLVDNTVGGTAVAERPAPAAKNGAKKKPEPEVSPSAKIRSAMPNAKEPEPKAKAKSNGKPAAKPAPKPEADEDRYDYDAEDLNVADQTDDDLPEEDDDDLEESMQRRRSRDRDDDADERAEHDDDQLDDATLALAEECGYTAKDARAEAAEAGGAKQFRVLLKAAKRMQARGGEREPERRAEPDTKKQPAAEKDGKDDDAELSFKEFDFDLESVAEEAQPLIQSIKKHYDGQGKILAGEVKKLHGMVRQLVNAAEQRNKQETYATLDRLFTEAKDHHDRFGRVPSRKLPTNSPLMVARNELVGQMKAIQDRRLDRGREPLELDELFHEALDSLDDEPDERTKTKTKLAVAAKTPKGTPTLRPNSRRSDPGRSPEKGQKTSLAKQREMGWI